MKLDQRIEAGSVVLVRREVEAVVIDIADDRTTLQVRAVTADEESEPTTLCWHEVKLASDHL